MTPAVFTSVLPRLCQPHRYHKVAFLGCNYQKTCLLNSHSSRQYGKISSSLGSLTSSPLDPNKEPDRLFKHRLNVCQLQKLSSSMIHTLQCKVDRYQCVHVDLGDIPEYVTAEQFSVVLNGRLLFIKIKLLLLIVLKHSVICVYICSVIDIMQYVADVCFTSSLLFVQHPLWNGEKQARMVYGSRYQ